MIFTSDTNIEEVVVEILADYQTLTARALHERVGTVHHSVSIQAVYDALRRLLSSNVVIKYKGTYQLSAEWRSLAAQRLQRIPGPPQLNDRESVRYAFTSYEQLDVFWKHLNATLHNIYPRDPIFFYNPHEFWILNFARQESQVEYIKSLRTHRDAAFMLLGGNTPCDNAYRNTYKEYLSIDLNTGTHFARNRHYTICGDYMISTKLPIATAEEIDRLYSSIKTQEVLQEQLQAIFSETTKLTVLVQRNKDRACSFRQRISKTMYVPRALREKYALFSSDNS